MNSKIKIQRLHPKHFSDFFELINQFRPCNIKKQTASNILLTRNQTGVLTFIATIDDIIVGTASIFIEQKFINHGGRIAHIEDVIVHKDYRGYGIGQTIMHYCIDYAKEKGCYKTILDCSEELEKFYNKIGMKNGNIQMEIRYK